MCVDKRMIATASIFSIAGMLLILIQCTYRFSLLMLKGQSLAHWAVLHKVEHLNDQKSTCMMSGQVNASKIIVMQGWASHTLSCSALSYWHGRFNMQLYYLHLLLMHLSSSMPAAAASMQNLTWLLSVVYVIWKQWDSLLHYTCQLVLCKFYNKSCKKLNGAIIYV